MTVDVPQSFDDMTPAWLEAALAESSPGTPVVAAIVASIGFERIGLTTGFLGRLARLTVSYAAGSQGPPTLIAKIPTDDPGGIEVGSMLGVWAREARFFSEVAALCGDQVPRCYYNGADFARGRFALLLQDCGPGQAADQLAGATDQQALAGVDALALLHGQWWGTPRPFPWMPGFDRVGFSPLQAAMRAALKPFAQRFANRVDPQAVTWLAAFVERLPQWASSLSTRPLTLVHADYRLDNLLYNIDGVPTIVDWQTALWGPGAMDLASFCATSLTVEDRRRLEPQLLERYRSGIQAAGQDLSKADLLQSYRECLLWWMAIFANNLSRLDPADERAQRLFEHMIIRTFTAAGDHDAGDVLAVMADATVQQ